MQENLGIKSKMRIKEPLITDNDHATLEISGEENVVSNVQFGNALQQQNLTDLNNVKHQN